MDDINKEKRKYERMDDIEFEKYSLCLRSLKRLKIKCGEFQKDGYPWGKHENGKEAVNGVYNHVIDFMKKCFDL